MLSSLASGIGLAVARRLLKLQWKVAILDRQPVTGGGTRDFDDQSSLFVKTNVAAYREQAKAFSQTHKKWGRVDLGVYCPSDSIHLDKLLIIDDKQFLPML